MKKWGKRIISGVIAASLLTAAAISGSEQGTGTVASVVQAGTETSFMGKLLEGGYIDVFTSWTQEEQNKFYDGLSPQQQSVFLEVTNCQITRELIKSERSKEELEQFFDRLQPYFLILKKGNQEKPDDEIVIECINQIEGTDYHSSEQYIKQLVSEKKDHYLEFYDALKLVKDGKLEIESAVDDFYKELGFLKKDRVPANSAEVSRQPVQVQKKAAAKAVSDRYSNFKAVSSLKALKDAVASVKKGEKIAVRVDKGFNVTSVIRTNGRHVKIYADGESGHNLNRTAGYKDVMLEVNGGSLTLGAYDGDGRAKNNLYINGKNIAASAPLIEVTSGHLYLNKYSRIIDGYFLAELCGRGRNCTEFRYILLYVRRQDRQLPGKEQQRRIFQFTEIFSRRRCPGRQWFFFLHVCGINRTLSGDSWRRHYELWNPEAVRRCDFRLCSVQPKEGCSRRSG